MYPFLAEIEGYEVPPIFDEKIYNLSPLYSDIISDIEQVKPFDKEHRTESYIGLKVQWKSAFSGFTENQDSYSVRVFLEKPLHAAYLEIDLSKDISKLKVLNENHPFWICGEISSISGTNITLINADVSV
jgi:hypothetical protein